MTRSRLKVIDVSLDLWKWMGCVCVGGTSADFKKWADKTFKTDVTTGEYAAGHAYVEYGMPWLIWVESLDNVPALAHEALHVAFAVLEARGLAHCKSSEEAYTYTMEHILRTALKAKKWQVAK